MKTYQKVILFISGLALSIAAAVTAIYVFFKKKCTVHIDFNPSEENSRECECENDDCEVCNPPEEEATEEEKKDDIEVELSEENA